MSSIKLISFDVFNTLISRVVIKPQTIFKIVQKILMTNDEYLDISEALRNNFYTIRINAEQFVQKSKNLGEKYVDISYNDIYDFLRTNYALTKDQAEKLKLLEFNTEKTNTVPITENINKLKEYHKKGYTIILISDMYFSSEQIRELLLPYDKIFNDIKIYVSNEYNATKNNGLLYEIIKKEYNVQKWLHIGDDSWSDIRKAHLCGLKTEQIETPKLLSHEEFLLKEQKNNLQIELSIGCAKSLRYSGRNDKYIFGLSFSAPILYNYVQFVLKQCIKMNIGKAYFVARDGYILKHIADIIIKKLNYPIKTSYFYSSRVACRIITHENYNKIINSIRSDKNINKTLEDVLAWLNIGQEDLQNYYRRNKEFNNDDLYNALIDNEELKQFIIHKNKDKLELFEKYLQQELESEEEKIAFVDIDGSGRTQDFISEIWNKNHQTTFYNFYLLNSPDMKQMKNSIKCSYLSNPEYVSYWLELLCVCIEGQTLGYRLDNDTNRIIPIKNCDVNKNVKNWGFEKYLQGITDYTNRMLTIERDNHFDVNSVDLYLTICVYLNNYIDKWTADMLGSIPFSIVKDTDKYIEAAPPIKLKTLFCHNHLDFISIGRNNKFIKPIILSIKKMLNPMTYGYISKKRHIAYLKVFNYRLDISNWVFKHNV